MTRLPDIDRGVLEHAMDEFDRGTPSPYWREVDWRRPGRQKYAIRYNGRLFPPKEVVRRAVHKMTGHWPEEIGWFHGGKEGANDYVCKRGLTIVMAPFALPPVPGTVPKIPHYTIVLEPQEDGWLATVPALQGCYAWANTQEEALAELKVVLEMIVGEYEDERKMFPPDVKVRRSAA